MGVVAGVILGIADAVGQGLVTKYQTDKLADAYADAANQVRMAANKYSGQAADSAMTQEGARQGQQMQKLAQSQGQKGTSGLSNVDAMTGMNNVQNNGLSGYMQGQNLGRSNKAQELNSKYNAETVAARNMLSRAQTDYNVGNQASNMIFNTLGGLVQGGASLFSDENCKESQERGEYDKTGLNNDSGLPNATIDDAMSKLETIVYKYKPEMGLDDKKHVGLVAQSCAKSPLFEDCVVKGDNGYLALDKAKLMEKLPMLISSLQERMDNVLHLQSNKQD